MSHKADKQQPVIYDLELMDEYCTPSASFESVFYITQENIVSVELSIALKASGEFAASPHLIAILPSGFRPKVRKHALGYCEGGFAAIRIYIDPDGSVILRPHEVIATGIFGEIHFLAAQ